MSETIWRAITEADMERHVMSPMLDALREAALAVGQADPMLGAIEDATYDIRVAVQSCKSNSVSATEGTVPPEWIKWGCYLALAAMQTRLSTLNLSEDQKKQIERAEQRLEKVGTCEIAVTAPSEALGGTEVQSSGGISVVTPNTDARSTTPEQMDGL